jgi:hypothetical protein
MDVRHRVALSAKSAADRLSTLLGTPAFAASPYIVHFRFGTPR